MIEEFLAAMDPGRPRWQVEQALCTLSVAGLTGMPVLVPTTAADGWQVVLQLVVEALTLALWSPPWLPPCT
jgi:hypothetical protein